MATKTQGDHWIWTTFYLRVPCVATGDAEFYLIEQGKHPIVGGAFPLPIEFESEGDLAASSVAYADAWTNEGELRETETHAVEVALADARWGG